MATEVRLSLRQTQRVVMTPLLQQAIQLLQLSTLELQELVQKELLENPLLEELPPDGPEGPESSDGSAESPAAAMTNPASEAPASDATALDAAQTEALPFDLTAAIFDYPEEPTLVQQEDREEPPFENFARTAPSLADHLEDQLRLATDESSARTIGSAIIGNIDEDGYLRCELDDIALNTEASVEEVEKVLALIQSFDPTGIAARTPQECLLIQLRADPLPDPVAVEIVEGHFEALELRRYGEIAKALKLPLDRIMEAVEEIQALEPKPGRKFGAADTRYITPDVFVLKMGDDYTVVLNEDGIPRLRVNPLYRRLLRGSGQEAKQYVEQKLRSAIWLIKSVHQRQRTLYRVTESIVKFQRAFLDKGLPFLRPLALRDVGEDISMHESTISRVTTNKYVQTPQGLFELKYFFHSGIATGNGDMVSSLSVKKMIRDLLAGEDSAKPLSDQELAQILRGRSLIIARRTVAKYREELGILPSHRRRLAPKRR
ncbi:MAG: RNA polymerase factor sigma-54 [Candidatus Rokubacteria bacterium]|nr:RNA polymerase factor sigma-54 [Candidatus Rokubacteria bacterium]